ncbi:MAG: hypothetical protein ACRDRQ_15915 [Pseudonocardiaceae bacterium]
MLLDALSGVPLSDAERASLTWLAGFETCTVENIAAVITPAPGGPREGDQQPDPRTLTGVFHPGVALAGVLDLGKITSWMDRSG